MRHDDPHRLVAADSHRPVALVTGASRGVGRGVAAELAASGFTVFATGRTVEQADLPEAVRRLPCDHTDDARVAEVFDRIDAEAGRLDVLVNSVWGGYERMVEDGEFTWTRPFWEQPQWRWDAMMDAGVRAGWVASRHAARRMLDAGAGLIVHLSHWAARKYVANVPYGVSKAATDRMVADMAHELEGRGVAVVSLYPGLVRTEAVLASGAFDLSNSESPAFTGRAVVALARDVLAHDARAREVLTRDVLAHDTPAHEALAPDVPAHDTPAHEALAPDVPAHAPPAHEAATGNAPSRDVLADHERGMRYSGRALVVARLAREYRFRDVDGSLPAPLTLEDA